MGGKMMKRSVLIRLAHISRIAIATLALTAVSCSTNLLDSIVTDVSEAKAAESLNKQLDTTPGKRLPIITAFNWAGNSTTTNNPAVAFNISAEPKAVTSDGTATIAQWYVSESSEPPASDNPNWAAAIPNSWTFSTMPGARTLYVCVRDSLGNISTPYQATITLSSLGGLWLAPYANGCTIAAHEPLVFTANETIAITGATITGTLGEGSLAFSGTENRTVTVTPGSLWSAGAQTITVSCATSYGLPLAMTLTVNAFNGECVATTGNDANDGSVRSPFATIQKAITAATAKYGTTPSVVCIAKGNYTIDSGTVGTGMELADYVSLQGEFTTDFQTFSPAIPLSTNIVDMRTSGNAGESAGGSLYLSGLTNAGTVSFLKLTGSKVDYCPVIQCIDSSPTIENCVIENGGDGTENGNRYAIRISGTSSPRIRNNSVNYNPVTGTFIGGGTSIANSFGIRLYGVTGVDGDISGNTISGGTALDNSYSIAVTALGSGKISIHGNTLVPGTGTSLYGIRVFNTAGVELRVYNNLIYSGNGYTSVSTGTAFGFHLSHSNNSYKLYAMNNTLVLGYPNSIGNTYLVYLNGIDAADEVCLRNNLFVYRSASAADTSAAVYEASASSVKEVRNNGFVGFSAASPAWSDYTGTTRTPLTTIANDDALIGVSVIDNVATGIGVGSPPLFAFTEANGIGLDGNALGWGFTDDFTGATRSGNGTTGWSVGYMERD
jgi:hypothetical protein